MKKSVLTVEAQLLTAFSNRARPSCLKEALVRLCFFIVNDAIPKAELTDISSQGLLEPCQRS